jgi:predicted TIM-barrel fold metal-dependent hydrolase
VKDGAFVFDAHTGVWDASRENCKNRFGEAFIETFYAFHTGFNPPDPIWTMDYETVFRKVDPDWYLQELFVKGDADMAILSTQVLLDFYHRGFVTADSNKRVRDRAPERIISLGGVDPRDPKALDEIARQVGDCEVQGFKWYTAEWRGESRGWKANDPLVFPLYEQCIALGVKNMHFHKGPAVEPLSLEKFDVRDIDEPAWLYPELNFIIDHVGLPRLDDFCWMPAQAAVELLKHRVCPREGGHVDECRGRAGDYGRTSRRSSLRAARRIGPFAHPELGDLIVIKAVSGYAAHRPCKGVPAQRTGRSLPTYCRGSCN